MGSGSLIPPPPPGFEPEETLASRPAPPPGFVQSTPETDPWWKKAWNAVSGPETSPPATGFIPGVGRGLGIGDSLPAIGKGIAKGYLYALSAPLAMALQGKEMLEGQVALGKRAASEGLTPEGVGHGIAAAVPVVGPQASSVVDTYQRGDTAGALGEAAGIAAPFLLGPALKKAGFVGEATRPAEARVPPEARTAGMVGPVVPAESVAAQETIRAVVPEVVSGSPVQPGRHPWEMSYDELSKAEEQVKAYEKNTDEAVLGPELAKEYNRAQRASNGDPYSEKTKAAWGRVDEIERSLTEDQRNRLFGIGEQGPTAEDLRGFRQAVGALDWESPKNLGASLRWAITKIGDKTNPLEMNIEQQKAYAQMRTAYEGAIEAGWDPREVSREAAAAAAARFPDPADAAFMLERFAKERPTQQKLGLPPEKPVAPPGPTPKVSPEVAEVAKRVADDGRFVHVDELTRQLEPTYGERAPQIAHEALGEAQKRVEGRTYMESYEAIPPPENLTSTAPDKGTKVKQWTRVVDEDTKPKVITWFEDPKTGEIRTAGGVTLENGEAHYWAHGRSIGDYVAKTTLDPLRAKVRELGWGKPREGTTSSAYTAREGELLGAGRNTGFEGGEAQGEVRGSVPSGQPGGEAAPPGGAGVQGSTPDVTDPYIYESLNPQKPRSSIAGIVQRLTPRAALPLLTAIEKKVPVVGEKIAETTRRYVQRFERGAMRWGQEATRLQADLQASGFKWEDLVDAAEKGDAQGRLGGFVKRFRAIDDHFLQRGKSLGVIPEENIVSNHYPHQPIDSKFFSTEAQAQRLADAKKIPLEQAVAEIRKSKNPRVSSASPFEANLQVRREGGFKEYRKDFEGYLQYVMDAERKFSDVEHFGRQGEKLQGLIDSIPDQATYKYVLTHMDRLRGLPQDTGAVGKVSGAIRGTKSYGSLGVAFVSQQAGIVPTASVGGVANTARGLWSIATGGRGLRGLKSLGENWRAAKLEAMPSIMANISTEMSEHLGSTGLTSTSGARGTAAKAFGKAKKFATAHLRATNWSDAAQRIVAYHTGKEFMPRIAAEAKAGSKGAQRIMRDLRIDWEKYDPKDAKHAEIGAKAFADFTQHRTGIADMPGWASSPLGKLAMQFKNVAYKQTVMTGKAAKWAVQGRPGPLIKMAVAGALVGNGVGALKDFVKGYGIQPENPKSWEDAMKRAGKGQRVTTDYPLIWAAQGMAMAGLGGVVDDAINKAANSPTPVLDLVGGPAYEGVRDAQQAYTTTRDKGLAEGGKLVAAAALRHTVPILGREAGRELKDFSNDDDSKIPERPGWIGRMRDVIEGEQDLLPALRGGTLTGEKSERRQGTEKRRLTSEDLKSLNAERKTLLPGKQKSQDEKDVSSQKRLAKARFAVPLIRAYQSGDEGQVRAILQAAGQAGVVFKKGELSTILRQIQSSQTQDLNP